MSDRFSPLTLDEIADLQIPDTEYVIDELFPEGSLTLLSAREKAGKGLLTIDAVVSVAFEEPFLDRSVRGGPAIYVAAEESIALVRSRVITRAGDRRDGPVYILPLNGYTDECLRLDDPDAMQKLQNMIEELQPSLVVMDTLRELHNRAENDSDDMGPLIRPLRQLAHSSGCAIVLNHHQNKQNGYRGSTAILAACDQEAALHRTDGDDSVSPTGTLTIRGRFGPKVVVHLKLGDGGRWQVTVPTITVGEQGLRGRILTAIASSPAGATAQDLHGLLQDPRPSLKTVQNQLSVMQQEQPRPFVVVGAGTRNDPRRFVTSAPPLQFEDSFEENGSFPTPNPKGWEQREPISSIVPIVPGMNGNQTWVESPVRRVGEA